MLGKIKLLKELMEKSQISNQGFLQDLKEFLIDIKKNPNLEIKLLDAIFSVKDTSEKAIQYIALSARFFADKYPDRYLKFISESRNKIDYILTLYENWPKFDIRDYTDEIISEENNAKIITRYALILKKSNYSEEVVNAELEKIFTKRPDSLPLFNHYYFSYQAVNKMSYYEIIEGMLKYDLLNYYIINSKVNSIKDLIPFYYLIESHIEVKRNFNIKTLRNIFLELSRAKNEELCESEFESIIEIAKTIGLAKFCFLFQDKENAAYFLKIRILKSLLKFYPESKELLQVYMVFLESYITSEKSMELDKEYKTLIGELEEEKSAKPEIKIPYKVYKKLTFKNVDKVN